MSVNSLKIPRSFIFTLLLPLEVFFEEMTRVLKWTIQGFRNQKIESRTKGYPRHFDGNVKMTVISFIKKKLNSDKILK